VAASTVGIGNRWRGGSGVVIGKNQVLTSAHNLHGDEPEIYFADGRQARGQVKGVDQDADLAVLDVDTADGPTRVFTLLHDARPVLLNFGEPGGFDISPWANRVRLVDAKHDGVWELPVLGEVAAPPAVVIRPDGHVAWAGDLTDPQLPQALATWFGAATPAHQNPTSERHLAHHLSAG